MNRHIFVPHYDHFPGHLASLVWAKLILGRFLDAVLPGFSRSRAGSDDYLNAFLFFSFFSSQDALINPKPWYISFFTDPRHGRYCGRYVPEA
jgi:hypothetical protein